ncbi:MAG TPA: extracellular solute-binding protein [Acetobacteraceae bacterium]|nr:extracellular solute-binding protein [Acetobacteraceae bacterium]
MDLRLLVAAGALAGCLAAASAKARDVAVAMRENGAGILVRDALDEIAFEPFVAAAANPVSVVAWSGGLDAVKAHAADWDVVALSAQEVQPGCDQGLFEKLDWNALGGRDRYTGLGSSDCGVGAFATATVLAWDRDKFPNAPTWSDFWDVAKFPGKRGLRKSPEGSLEIALLADGVAPRDIYGTLGSNDGVARAFRKLDQLKPYLVFWSSTDEAIRILGSGDVLMTSASNSAVVTANRDHHRNFGTQWAGNLTAVDAWAVIKGGPDTATAMKLLVFLGDPKLQSRYPAAAGFGGLAKGANDGLPPDVAALSPTLPANLDKAVVVDGAFWRDNRAKLAQQFDAWLAAH